MTTYENFIVPNSYWEYVLQEHRISFINEYHKKHKKYPSEEDLQKVVLSADEKERYKRLFYARYCATGTVPSEPTTPSVPTTPPTNGNEDNNEQETPNTPITPPSSENIANVMFNITMDDIPETVGVDNKVVNTIFKQGILNGDLLDKSQCNITLKNENITIDITDLTKTYMLPFGEYSVSGTIGEKVTTVSDDKTFLKLDTTIIVNSSGEILLKPQFHKNIIISNSNFILQWKYSNGYNNYTENYDSYIYEGFSYTFSHTPGRLNSRVIIFNDIKYTITKDDWVEGTCYYYDIDE